MWRKRRAGSRAGEREEAAGGLGVPPSDGPSEETENPSKGRAAATWLLHGGQIRDRHCVSVARTEVGKAGLEPGTLCMGWFQRAQLPPSNRSTKSKGGNCMGDARAQFSVHNLATALAAPIEAAQGTGNGEGGRRQGPNRPHGRRQPQPIGVRATQHRRRLKPAAAMAAVPAPAPRYEAAPCGVLGSRAGAWGRSNSDMKASTWGKTSQRALLLISGSKWP